ncbi:MAG: polymer-forming cytoskeletal protein [Thermoanaerobaculia bacterium]
MPTSLIAVGTELTGRLTCPSDLRCEGSFHGDIEILGDLTVCAGARVEGSLRARTVTVSGAVRGPVRGDDQVEVLRGGSVTGDISSACIVLAEGSELDGRIDIAT